MDAGVTSYQLVQDFVPWGKLGFRPSFCDSNELDQMGHGLPRHREEGFPECGRMWEVMV